MGEAGWGSVLVFEGSASGAMLMNLESEGHGCFHSWTSIPISQSRWLYLCFMWVLARLLVGVDKCPVHPRLQVHQPGIQRPRRRNPQVLESTQGSYLITSLSTVTSVLGNAGTTGVCTVLIWPRLSLCFKILSLITWSHLFFHIQCIGQMMLT